MICELIGWAIFGLLIGAIARLIWPARQSIGMIGTMLLGVAGSVVGGLIVVALRGGPDSYHPAGWLMSIVGAIIVLWLFGGSGGRGAIP
jgi:uncharacterized membrane protein YeaQ/YmgE (transglycosylase-associated protein family)